MKNSLTTLIFDLDGTLIDSRADLSSAVNHVLTELGHSPQTMEQIVPKIGNGLRRLLMDTVGLNDIEELKKAKIIFDDYYDDHCLDETHLYPGVESCIREFADNFNLAIVTNKPEPFAKKILATLNVEGFFDLIYGGDSLPLAKPDPTPLREAMKILNSSSKQTMMVGDGIQDLQAGKSAEMKTCLVRYGFGYRPELLELNPDFVINRFVDLKEILS